MLLSLTVLLINHIFRFISSQACLILEIKQFDKTLNTKEYFSLDEALLDQAINQNLTENLSFFYELSSCHNISMSTQKQILNSNITLKLDLIFK